MSDYRRSSVVWGLAAIVALVTAILLVKKGFFGTDEGTSAGSVVVVAAPHEDRAWKAVTPTDDDVGASVPTPEAAMVAAMAQFPSLKDASLQCTGVTCEMTAAIIPATTDAARDAEQAMLLGGLQTLLGSRGYVATAPVQLDENGENDFSLRLQLRPSAADGRSNG